MTVTATRLGHTIVWDQLRLWWRWQDTGELLPRPGERCTRPCKLCGAPPTEQGYDACIGYIPGARAACCGHGAHGGYVMWENGIKSVAPTLVRPPLDPTMEWMTLLVTTRPGHLTDVTPEEHKP